MPRRAGTGAQGNLPDLELECMKVLWDGGELTVREVRERLRPRRTLAYTTVLTVLDRLAQKGAVSRRKMGRALLYQAAFSQAAAREAALARLVEHYFGGSRQFLLQHLAPGVASGTTRAASASTTAGAEAEELDPALL